MNSKCSRRGITLVELIVVTGIIGLLIAMILPAIQRVREASNQLLCKSNLKQFGTAVANYHVDHHRLPPGYLGPAKADFTSTTLPTTGQWVGHFPLLLPYIEQDDVVKAVKINFNSAQVTSNEWFFNEDGISPNLQNITSAQCVVKLFRCLQRPNSVQAEALQRRARSLECMSQIGKMTVSIRLGYYTTILFQQL